MKKMTNKQVLIIEDDPDIGDILTDLFNDAGYNAICAETGSKALEQLERDNFDLVTLDLRLPDMNGNELLHELARRSFSNPVVVISANLEYLKPSPVVRAVLPKPFDVMKLLNIVQEYV